MTDSRTLVSILCVCGIEPEVEHKRLIAFVSIDKVYGTISDDLCLVTLCSIRQFMKVGVSPDSLEDIIVILRFKIGLELEVPLPEKAYLIPSRAELVWNDPFQGDILYPIGLSRS